MAFWVLIILAVIQGLTEFLPISSSGHLVLLYNFFGIQNNEKLLSILLHIATLLSVLIYYRKELVVLIKNPFCSTNKKIAVTTLFTCLVVIFIKPAINKVQSIGVNLYSNFWFIIHLLFLVFLF